MILSYLDKKEKKLNDPRWKGKEIVYTLSLEDLEAYQDYVQELISLNEYDRVRILLKKDNKYDLIVDAISDSYLIAGISKDQKPVIVQYIIKEGNEAFIKELLKNY